MICTGNIALRFFQFSRHLLVIVPFLITVTTWGKTPADSIRPVKTFLITPRLNSAGHFPFSGALINHNINADINIYYQRGMSGFFLFKSWDLRDPHSIVNYFQPGIFQKFNVGTKVNTGFFAGYIFSQTDGFSDHDSDFFLANVTTWTPGEKLRIENTALFFNLTKPELSTTLANRLLINYFVKKWKFDLYVWERVEFRDKFFATSASFAINFPKIRLTNAVYILNTVSYQGYITDAKPDWAMRDGFLYSLSFPITPN
jgi:hypothetical protein